MFFPEALYILSQRDQQVTWLDPQIRKVSGTGAAAQVISDRLTTIMGRAFLLQHALAVFDPGAGQNFASGEIRVVAPGGDVFGLAVSGTAGGANVDIVLSWQGSVIIPPDWGLDALGNFNAGVAANTVTLTLMGILIPVGNIQRL